MAGHWFSGLTTLTDNEDNFSLILNCQRASLAKPFDGITMKKLFRMAYISAASKPFSKGRLRNLVNNSRSLNATSGITGILLHKEGHFMQLMEGSEPAVKAAFDRICRDTRHFGIIVLIKESADERHYPGQPMAFQNLDLPEQRTVPGYDEFLDTPLTGKEFASQPSRGEKLLLLFKPGSNPG